MTDAGAPTIGVEEEYFLVRPGTRAPQPAAAAEGLRVCASGTPVVGEFAMVIGDHPR